LGIEEEEKDGEYIISKVFYQQQQIKQSDKNGEDNADVTDDIVVKVDPVTPKSITPKPPWNEMRLELRKESTLYLNSANEVVLVLNIHGCIEWTCFRFDCMLFLKLNIILQKLLYVILSIFFLLFLIKIVVLKHHETKKLKNVLFKEEPGDD